MTAFYFGLMGPLIGIALLILVVEAPGLAASTIINLVISAYIIGLPPMLATGFLTSVAAQRGRSFAGLTATAAILGLVFGAISAVLWVVLGLSGEGPSIDLIVAIALAGAVAGFCCTLILGLMSLFRRHGGAA